MCSDKMSYRSHAEAEAAGRRRLELRDERKLWVYRCPQCGLWHLTKAEKSPTISARLSPVLPEGKSENLSQSLTLGDLLAKFKDGQTR